MSFLTTANSKRTIVKTLHSLKGYCNVVLYITIVVKDYFKNQARPTLYEYRNLESPFSLFSSSKFFAPLIRKLLLQFHPSSSPPHQLLLLFVFISPLITSPFFCLCYFPPSFHLSMHILPHQSLLSPH